MAPTFFNATMHILIATSLYHEQLVGDEPEPLEVVPWSIKDSQTLLNRADFVEARSIVALLMAEKWSNEKSATQ